MNYTNIRHEFCQIEVEKDILKKEIIKCPYVCGFMSSPALQYSPKLLLFKL